MMRSCPKKQIPMLTRWGDFILSQRVRISIPKTSSKRSRAGQPEWRMLCSAASDRSTTTSASFFSNGSQSICTRLSARWHRAKVTVWREEAMRWTSVVRAQIHRFVLCYIHSHGRNQAARVYRIDRMSARRPPCRVCPVGSMPGCRCVERSPSGRR